MAAHRLGKEEAALDIAADVPQHDGQVLVVGLLLEDCERRHDVQAGLDHRRELPREDLEGLRLHALHGAAEAAALRGRAALYELEREQPARAQRLVGPARVAGADLAGGLEAGGVDRGVGVGGHPRPSYRRRRLLT